MSKKQNESNKRIAFPIRLFAEEGDNSVKLSDTMHVIPIGAWEHPEYGPMEITSEHIDEFIKNFKDKVRRDIPITAGHDNGMSGGELPAIGWFKELFSQGVRGLFATVEWTEEGARLLKERAFKYFSPEFYETYSDPETGETYKHVLVGGALTNKPYFKELEPVVAFSEPVIINQFNETMDLNTILSKKPEELSDEEKAFLKENEASLDDSQKETFKSVLEDGAGDGADDGAGDGDGDDAGDDDGADDGADAGADDEQKDASEKGNKGKMVQMSETEAKTLREKADKGAQAFAELEKMKLSNIVEALIFSEKNKDGRFAVKQKDSVVSFMLTLSERQRDQFKNIVAGMPKSSLFTEHGDAGKEDFSDDVAGSAKKADELAKEKVKASDGKLKYSDALKQVFAEHPELASKHS